ncbi:glycosyltransferase [Flaviaesturariibacter amylovorans]|uniref:Glycosyltransferase n=1 Tax=Flaviaesturariibacter amylovorans TaxID=1084520 RepID=A0ABP8HK46_9BACT
MTAAPRPDPPTVLVAALDWGLGHATRCIPIIRCLLAAGVAVRLAGSGPSGALLRLEFPDLPYNELPATSVHYARSRHALLWKILLQVPKLRKVVEAENRWLHQLLNKEGIRGVISDNRYGLHHPGVRSVLITHQLSIRTPLGRVGNDILRWWHYRLIGRFSACWVPDHEGAPNLAGALAHPRNLPPVPTRYIGPLSRFAPAGPATGPKRLVLLLSGPEPQRSLFERQLCAQLPGYGTPVLLVRGLPRGGGSALQLPAHVQVLDHLSSSDLHTELSAASFVLARSGYSTVMDLAALGVRGILVPTPGQPEQEYLGRHLQSEGFAPAFRQEDFDLAAALAAAERFPYRIPQPGGPAPLERTVREWLATLPAS